MRTAQMQWSVQGGWDGDGSSALDGAQLVLLFGGREQLAQDEPRRTLREAYPNASVVGCSTAGEILGDRVFDETLVATALQFDHTKVRVADVALASGGTSESLRAGELLGQRLQGEGLRHVLVFSDGILVNGSELVRGFERELGPGVTLSGGLSGDGSRFEETVVLTGGRVASGVVTAVGLYGSSLRVASASLGGWDPFGPERVITRSEGNVLYELGGASALDLYKHYLGHQAADLPGSALLFPLAVRADHDQTPIVRTVLAVDEDARSMTFAGDVPEGHLAQLMSANFDRLIDGAARAASISNPLVDDSEPSFALLISCVGRKMVLGQRIEEEVEAVREVLGPAVPLAGFYSYGEISPFAPETRCELHNQTMTVTTLQEQP